MANSKGGAIFIGIHNIYGRGTAFSFDNKGLSHTYELCFIEFVCSVKGISLWELTNHKLVNEIQRVCT